MYVSGCRQLPNDGTTRAICFVCSSIFTLVTARCCSSRFREPPPSQRSTRGLRRSSTRVLVCHKMSKNAVQTVSLESAAGVAAATNHSAFTSCLSSGMFSLLAGVRLDLENPISLRAGGFPSVDGLWCSWVHRRVCGYCRVHLLRLRALLDYIFMGPLNFVIASGPSRGRGEMAMAIAALARLAFLGTQYVRCCPLFPVQ